MSRWQWLMARLSRQLWVRTSIIGVMGVLIAVLSAVIEPYLPWELSGEVSSDAVDSLLSILASSMLAVTTFSLSIMVSAYGSATNTATPRATKLLIEDTLTQTVLANFVGSFLFGIVGLVMLKVGLYGERGRVVLFVATIIVIALVVLSLMQWIDHLTKLGRLGETTDRVEAVTRKALEARLAQPYMGGEPLFDPERDIPPDALKVTGAEVGYVQNVDMPALSAFCQEHETRIYVAALPGTFMYPGRPLLWVGATPALRGDSMPGADGEGQKKVAPDPVAWRETLQEAFSIGNERSFEQDPRFGLAVMSEIASRALSPAVNDPGTAIGVIGRLARLLNIWAVASVAPPDEKAADQPPDYPDVHVPPVETHDLFEDAFMLIARDGAGMIEVQLPLQKALLALSEVGDQSFSEAALAQSRMALDRAEASLPLEEEKRRLRALARKVEQSAA
ncbi:MAG: DUF2254 domain-containing protein [Lautropia sp.]|nr:DUF2254 domain-containing protein [Lautropia sp.]